MKTLTLSTATVNACSCFMKPSQLRLLTLLGAALVALAPLRPARAADNNPPTKLTHQGFLTDANGLPLGNAAPTNKTIIFRIFNAPAAGTRLWAAQQVVTVDKGHYSVLLGEGSAVVGESFLADLSTIFDGTGASDRFLEISVDGAALAPRLQFLPAPFAMLARKAMTVDRTAILLPGQIDGTLDVRQIPFLPANKITGVLATELIPLLDAKKITGVLANDLIPSTVLRTSGDQALAGKLTVANGAGNIGLDVNGYARIKDHLIFNSEHAVINWGGSGNLYFRGNNTMGDERTFTGKEHMTITSVGNVGIGRVDPKAPLHVFVPKYGTWVNQAGKSHVIGNNSDFGFYLGANAAGADANGFENTYGDDATIVKSQIAAIFEGMTICKDRMYVGSFTQSSDLRAKKVLGLSKPEEDLATLLNLRVTDYNWIDRSKDGHRKHKQLIAQDVEKAFPQAIFISPSPEVIPNVYEVAAALEHDAQAKILRVTTKKVHEFKTGDKVDIMVDSMPMTAVEVKAVLTPHQFVVAAEKPAKKVFVYGKQVNDFRSVDYTAISMLNVSATQELARQNEALKKRVSELESRERQVTALQKRVTELEGLERQVADLQKLVRQVAERQSPSPRAGLSGNGPVAVLPVSAR